MSMIEVIGPILCPTSAPGKIDIETDWAQSPRFAQLIYICRRGLGRTNYVTMIHTMKKLLIPLFSVLIAIFLSSCAHEPTSTTTSTTTRETTVQQPTTTQQTTTTHY